jgi:hypothetical protein
MLNPRLLGFAIVLRERRLGNARKGRTERRALSLAER